MTTTADGAANCQIGSNGDEVALKRLECRGTTATEHSNDKQLASGETSPNVVEKLLAQFRSSWERAAAGSVEGLGMAYDSAHSLACQVIEYLVKCGLDEFHRLEKTTRSLNDANERIESTSRELVRVRLSEAKSRESIANLLKAVDASKSKAREESSASKTLASLRTELGLMRKARDEALKEATESKRKASLLADELQVTNAKISRISQEKIKLERENRAAKALAKKNNVGTIATSEWDFYKRKAAALSGYVQSLEAVLGEKNQEIEELRRQIERSLSQNHLANIRSNSSRKRRI